jgi:hypothetical protein
MSDAYCRGCGSKINATAPFCPLCGSSQAGPQARPAPPPPPQTIVVKQRGSFGTFWVVFTLLAIFTPLGCIVFPMLILGGGIAVFTGVALLPWLLILAPMLLSLSLAARMFRDPSATKEKRMTALGIMAIGTAISLTVAYLVTREGKAEPSATPVPEASPTPTPEKRPYVAWLDFDAFGRDYDKNKIAVKTRYEGKRIALRGKVGYIDGEKEFGQMTLKGMNTMAEATCVFNERTTKQLANVQSGQMVDVIGEFDGGKEQSFGSDKLKLYDCTFPATAKAQISR